MASTNVNLEAETQAVLKLLEPLFKSWADADVEGIVACYSDTHIELADIAMGATMRKKDEIRAFLKSTFETFSDATWTVVEAKGTKDFFTLETVFNVTAKVDNPLSKQGVTSNFPGAVLFKFDAQGKITSQKEFVVVSTVGAA